MSLPTSNPAPRRFTAKRLASAALAVAVVAALGVFGTKHLVPDLALLAEVEAAAPASGAALPVDGPAVTKARVGEQVADGRKNLAAVAAADSVLQLDEWQFTQASSSPFLFDAPNGFDFFNPLFAFNFGSPPQNNFNFFGPVFMFGNTPFGFPSASGNGGGFQFGGSSGGGGTFTTSTPGSGGTTNSSSFNNGATVFISVTSTTIIAPIQMGSQGFSHRHGFSNIIIVINVVVIVNTPQTPSQ
jgi:hypothetical protein